MIIYSCIYLVNQYAFIYTKKRYSIQIFMSTFPYKFCNYTNITQLPSSKMTSEHAQCSKGKLKYFPQQGDSKCHGCQDLSKKFDTYKDAAKKRYTTLIDILAEHKVLLDRIIAQNILNTNMLNIFPITTEDKLKEFDNILQTQPDPYTRQIKLLLGGNVERNLHQVFGHDIIMNFNVDGSFGKKRLKDYGHVYNTIIDVISTFNESPDKLFRAAFQRQKKKFFKQKSRNKANNTDEDSNEKY